MLDINFVQIEKELAEQLGVTQQAIFVCLQMMEKVQKEGKWIPHELSEDNKNRLRDTALTLPSKFRKKMFCTKLLHTMKTVFFIITLDVVNHGLILVNLQLRRQSPISTLRMFCSVFDGKGVYYALL